MVLDKWIESVVTITPDTAAYSANDVIGASPLVFDVSGSVSNGGLINTLVVVDNEIGAAGALWLFKPTSAGAAPTTIADNGAFAPVFADLQNLMVIITLPSFITVNSLKVALLEDVNTRFYTQNGKLYGYYVPSGAPDWAASKTVQISMGILGQQ
jgi:hypothetical protein